MVNTEELQSNKALKILKSYEGPNPYIAYLRRAYERKGGFELTNKQEKFIIENQNVEPTKIEKVIEIAEDLGEQLRSQEDLSFVPERIYFDSIVSENEKAYLILGKMKRNQKSNEFYWIPKAYVIDDPYFEEPEVDIDFTKYEEIDKLGRHPYEHQKEDVKFLVPRRGAILANDMGLGKLLPNDEPVLTPDGWVKNGSLKIGDYVMGSNGEPTKVIGTFPSDSDYYYKITFTDGTEVECCEDHLWSVRTPTTKKRDGEYITLSVKQMLNPNGEIEVNGEGWNSKRRYTINTYYRMKNGDCKWYIPIVDPIKFNERSVYLSPYLLGVLLGDGSISENRLGFTNIDEPLINEVKNNLPENIELSDYEPKKEYGFKLKNKQKPNTLFNSLKQYDLINTKSDTKFIPDDYKYNTIDVRLETLQGLMDTDGYCSEKDGTLQFYSTSKQLSDDVKELVQSLGGVARQSEKNPTYTHNNEKRDGKKCYILTINLPEDIIPFKLDRKINNMKNVKKYYPSRGIKHIEFSRKTSGQCISVEAEDNLYVMDEYVVTHNTYSALIAALEVNPEKVLLICPANMKITWYREIESLGETDITIVNGSIWNDSKFTIVNYDILKNFHTPFNERRKMDKNDISDVIRNAGFDMVIVDEAHKIKNNKSKRGKIVKEISVDNLTVETTWLLTGTPISNKPMDYFNLLKTINSELTNNWVFFAKRYCKAFQINKPMKNGKSKKIWITDGASNLEELSKKTKNIILRRKKEEVLDLPDKMITPMVYDLTKKEWDEYDNLWDDYLEERMKQGKKGAPQKDLVELTLLRQFIANAAVSRTIELSENILEQNDENKVVIFTSFQEEQDELVKHFGKKCVIHNGSMSDKKKQKSIDDFQNKKNKKVFIGNIQSAGVGITLTASNYIIFNSFSWVPGDNEQAEDRCYRIGQENNVTVFYQLFKDTISEYMWGVLKNKKEIINRLLDEEDNQYKKEFLEELKDDINYD